jgi:hypothetical protein
VTFYDGATVLGTTTLTGGQATLSTILLPSGPSSLKAYYGGDANHAPSTSAPLTQTVNAVPGGQFQAAVNYGAGSEPIFVALGDFNGDGRLDIVVTNFSASVHNGSANVLLGNGDGTFQAAVSYSVGGNPISVAVGDFNGDGKADLAVCNFGGYVSVLLGNGDGTFRPAVNYSVAGALTSIAMGDFDGDGNADLVVTNWGSSGVSVLLGNGDGPSRLR